MIIEKEDVQPGAVFYKSSDTRNECTVVQVTRIGRRDIASRWAPQGRYIKVVHYKEWTVFVNTLEVQVVFKFNKVDLSSLLGQYTYFSKVEDKHFRKLIKLLFYKRRDGINWY
jgi:hypothetical protein